MTSEGHIFEEVTEFTYLVVKARISKARRAFAALKNTWKTNKISNITKIRLFKSNVLSMLFHAAES